MNNQYRKRIGWSSPFLSALQKKRSRQGSCGFPEKSTNFSTKTGIMNNLPSSEHLKRGGLAFGYILQEIPDSFVDRAFRQLMQHIAQPFVHPANRPV
jgi:hypothetical protein